MFQERYLSLEERRILEKEQTDHDLLRALAAGETAAFDVIVDRYKKPITNYITRMIGDYDRALDLCQETLLRVYLNAGRYQFISTFSSWIYKIATNLALNEIRRRKKVRFLPLLFQSSKDEFSDPKVKEVEDPQAETPLDRMEQSELNKVLNKEIATLPVRYRTPLVLRDVQELSYQEIAEITSLPIGTVKSRINRARRMLKTKIEPYL